MLGLAFGLLMALKSYLPFLYWDESDKYTFSRYAVPHIVNYLLWGFLVPFVYYFSQKYPVFGKVADRSIISKAILASLGLAIFHELFSNLMWFFPMHQLDIHPFTNKDIEHIIGMFPSAVISRLIEYWIIFGVFTTLDFQKKYRDKQIQLAQLESQLSGAQLSALRLQLQPHFLFNTLNTISSLMEINIKDAQKIVSKFGNLLRIVLEKNKRNNIPFREELEFTKNYLDIEAVRFIDRLKIEYNINPDALSALVPSLILQPLVENAFKHGFSNQTEDGLIIVSAKRQDAYLRISVKDDGNGTKKSKEILLSSGIGLKNVKERLDLIYKNDYRFEIESGLGQGFEVILEIPFRRENN